MSYFDLALIFFLLLVVLNNCAQRSVLYPPSIFCALWLLDLAVIRLDLIEFHPVHGNTLAIVSVRAASFSVGSLLAGLVPPESCSAFISFRPAERRSDSLRNTLMIVLLSGLPVMFYQK
jgi:hypothetical protein